MTDEKLLQKAGRGDEAAFLALYERHRDTVFRFAYRVLGSAALAEEVAHDCFLSLVRRPEAFDPSRASLRTYLYAAARNLSLKHLRRHGGESSRRRRKCRSLVCLFSSLICRPSARGPPRTGF